MESKIVITIPLSKLYTEADARNAINTFALITGQRIGSYEVVHNPRTNECDDDHLPPLWAVESIPGMLTAIGFIEN